MTVIATVESKPKDPSLEAANTVLLVDDDLEYSALILELLAEAGLHADHAETWAQMEERLAAREYALVVLDVRLPDGDSIDRLPELVQQLPHTPVLIATSINDVAMSVEAMRRGATSYVTKGLEFERIIDEILQMLPSAALDADGTFARARAVAGDHRLVGEHPRFLRTVEDAMRFAEVDATGLIVGEPGTGKRRFAEMIHRRSARRHERFLALKCGGWNEDELDAELFGEPGRPGRPEAGLFRRAGRGTVFLQEVGELPSRLQAKLLRALQERFFLPVGAGAVEPLDARLLASTDRPLERKIGEGTFREDLFFALSVLRLDVPALRERASDIPLLVKDAIDRSNAQFHRQVAYPSSDVMTRLMAHRWSGNVSELQNTVERAVALAAEGRIEVRSLFPSSVYGGKEETEHGSATFAEAKRAFEMEYLTQVLKDCGGNLAEAARRAGLHRPQLYRLLHRNGLGRHAGPTFEE